ncbi:phosphotransferase [Actinopolymorpha sp. B11F2]|uniref:phosphotransferase n=1 Tax=Actinopolymorpha sp. B11F2 TaxID=3160862 RepID=UPI0032E41DDF
MNSHDRAGAMDDLVRMVATEYDVGIPTGCRLMESGLNDTYAVEVDGSCYALRLHGQNKPWIAGEGDLRFELSLLDHLHAEGVPVSVSVRRRDGDSLGLIETATGNRYCVLFTWAPGRAGADTEEHARRVGQTLAAIHVASDGFRTMYNRYALDERHLLDRPLKRLEASARESDSGAVEFIRGHVSEIRRRLQAFKPGPGGWGVIHADPQVLNIHFTDGGQVTWFDFDLCGYGWRAYDLAYYYTRIPERFRAAVLYGYQAVRPLSDAELNMLPTLGRAAWVWECIPPADLVEKLKNPYDVE